MAGASQEWWHIMDSVFVFGLERPLQGEPTAPQEGQACTSPTCQPRADSLEAFQVVAKLFVYVCLDIFVKRISRVFIKISRGPIIQERQGMIVL